MKKCIICNQNIEVIIDKDMEKVVCDECINKNHISKADELLVEIFKTDMQAQVRKAFKVNENNKDGYESWNLKEAFEET